MGVFTRADSVWFWLYLEPMNGEKGIKERTILRADAKGQQHKDNRDLAEQLYHARMTARARGELQPEKKPARTFSQQASWWETHRLPHRKGKEREGPLVPKLVAVFGDEPLSAVTRTLVTERWITPRLTTPTIIKAGKRTGARRIQSGPNTINREVDLLKAIMQSAVPDYLDSSPLYGMPKLRTTTPQRRLMTPDEEARLLAVMEPDDTALFLIALDSLVRMGDVLDIKRTHDKGAHLWIADPKSGGGFPVNISSRARAALDAWYDIREIEPNGYVFARRRRADTERDRRNGIRQMLERYCRIAAVPFGRKDGGLTFHWATRRTGLTRMLTRKVDLGTAQKIGRWKTPGVVLSVYHELIDKEAQKAVDAVGPRRSRPIPESGRKAG